MSQQRQQGIQFKYKRSETPEEYQICQNMEAWPKICKIVHHIHQIVKDTIQQNQSKGNSNKISNVMDSNTPETIINALEDIRQNLINSKSLNNYDNVKKDQIYQNNYQTDPREQRIVQLQKIIEQRNKDSKNFQLKMLQNIKRMNKEIQQKDLKIRMLNKVFTEKQRQINKDFNDQYDQVKQIEEKNEKLKLKIQKLQTELETQRECCAVLELKLNKIYQNRVLLEQETNYQHQEIEKIESESEKQISQISYQTKNSISLGIQTEHTEHDENTSQLSNPTQLTSSKETKYLESIDRLKSQLTDAYQKLNDFLKVDELTSQQKKLTKLKTNSSYFEKISK